MFSGVPSSRWRFLPLVEGWRVWVQTAESRDFPSQRGRAQMKGSGIIRWLSDIVRDFIQVHGCWLFGGAGGWVCLKGCYVIFSTRSAARLCLVRWRFLCLSIGRARVAVRLWKVIIIIVNSVASRFTRVWC
ncbi:hypothetical protein, unlikely [Trypanosoma brucei gambiense DAL972]|uniref:Uncharacterized protein n=2 Tax=Trypanosoma brucei TaxID=5691 RepID=C9ZIS0_TRYB9|nr:hypothetical protein, unlikely [Trypanosoma brucei gambiense DAL972]RHW74502.1 hypothetical protein DPX39_010036000 [Trypanosoma brucei equiperdum]CBH09062.1 hypothetical protein, unlikely [Trypanosoma brucei gambiense DAL972]|eukprot:XP_011771503.1 hypothetical protein, unlikely [Trypanosoma brucei gambiense DAL972]